MLLLSLFFHEQFWGELFVIWNGYVLICIDFVGVGVQLLLTLFFHEQFWGELFVVWNG
jgi:hypothetical protein